MQSTSYRWVERVVKEAAPDWAACIQKGLSSGEGLISAVRDGNGDEDPGVSEKRLMVVESEFASVLKRMTGHGVLILPGTKTKRAWRRLPLKNSNDLLALMKQVMAIKRSKTATLFEPWSNIRRDLHVACAKAKIDPVSPNDLRRTFATWCWQGGMHPSRIALLLGHRDARMVERVYGVLDSATLGDDVTNVFSALKLPTAANPGRPSLRLVRDR